MKVILLAGGGGYRLWPISTKENPKQFVKLPMFTNSLFQLSLKRALLFCKQENIFVVTSKHYEKQVFSQSQEIGFNLNYNQVFLESKQLNTLPAILVGVLANDYDANENILVLPSDHIFGDDRFLLDAVVNSSTKVNSNIVVFGKQPTSNHIGFGYIQPGILISEGLFYVDLFIEKPDFKTAKKLISNGCLWNLGVLYFNSDFFIQSLNLHQPEMVQHFLSYENLSEAFDSWKHSVSIDYGFLENISSIIVSKVDTEWYDIGSFDDLIEFNREQHLPDQINCTGSVMVSNSNVKVVIIGVDNLIVVHTINGILICKKGESQHVKLIK